MTTVFVACEKEQAPSLLTVKGIFYVAGYNSPGINVRNDGTAEPGAFLFISENLKDTVCVNNSLWNKDEQFFYGYSGLLNDLFDFPVEIMPQNICGFALFPQGYRYKYKVNVLSSRPMTESEKKATIRLCNAMMPMSDIHPNKYAVVESISKVK